MQEQVERRIAGRYLLVDVLGRGGMGIVWRARDEMLGREVAVKEVTAAGSSGSGEALGALAGRALREARTAARLNHPGAVVVHDAIEDGGRLWIVMELVDAPTLGALVAAGPLPPARVAAIGEQLAGVLAAAHRLGIVHRDVKPSNVMVPADGTVKLTDFGIASLRDDPHLTTEGVVLGSPGYMAPEQAAGGPVGPPADLWSLGATLYYAVEGRAPHTRDSRPAIVAALLTQPPDPMRRAGPLEPLLASVLRVDPAERPPLEQVRRRLHELSGPASDLASEPASGSAPDLGAPVTRPLGGGEPAPGAPAAAATTLRVPPPGSMPVQWSGPPSGSRALSRPAVVVLALAGALVVALLGVAGVLLLRPDAGSTAAPGGPSSGPTVRASGPAVSQPAGSAGSAAGSAVSPPAGSVSGSVSGGPAGSEGDGSGRRALALSEVAPSGQVLPNYWSSATNTVGGYRVAVPGTWQATADGATTFLTWPGDSIFDAAFEIHSYPGAGEPITRLRQDAAAFAGAHAADAYRQVRLTPSWEYGGRPAAAWEFTWNRNGTATHGLQVAFRSGSRMYTILYRSKELWWNGGGSAEFPQGFEQGFTPLG